MTVTDLSQTVTITPTLTPVQEKAIFCVDVPAYFKVVNNEDTSDNILDSTLAILKKLELGDIELTNSWLMTKTITNEFDYAILMHLLSRYQQENNTDNTDTTNSFVLNKIISIDISALPSFSNLLAWDSFDDISLYLSRTSFASCNTIELFSSKFSLLSGKSDQSDKSDVLFRKVLFFYFAFNHFKQKSELLEALCVKFESFLESCQKQLNFPTANQTNENQIDPLIKLAIYLTQDTSSNAYLDFYQVINKYIYVTYQNVRIMKLWCISSLNIRSLDETRATFRTYLNYVADYKVKNNGEYYDIVDVIKTYTSILEYLSTHMTITQEYNELKKWFDEVLEIMNTFNAVIGTNLTVYKNPLREMVADTYFTLASIYENFLSMEIKPFDKISEIVTFLKKSADTLDHRSNELKLKSNQISFIYYVHSFYLHKSGISNEALKYAKHAMKHSPDNIKYINYYVKLLSGNEEDLDTAILISQQVIENLHDSVKTEDPIKWTIWKKRDALEAYLIFLTLLGEFAVDALAPFFGFVNRVFGNENSLNNSKDGKAEGKVKTASNIRLGKNKNNELDEGCSPCAPNSINTVSSVPNSNRGKLRSLLHLKKKDEIPIFNGNNKIGGSIRRSLQVNRLNHRDQTKKPTQSSKQAADYGSLTPNEVSALRMMWLTLSRIFQVAGDIDTALQCVDEASSYSVSSMMLSTKNSKNERIEEKIHTCAIQARKGCIYANSDDLATRQKGKLCLLEAIGIIESLGGIRKWSNHESVCAAEAIVGFTQLCLKCLNDETESKNHEDYLVGLSRCRKHLELVLESVNWGDDARCWLLLGDVYERKNMLGHDSNIVATPPGKLEEECVMRGVHGWHGLQILQQ